MNPNPIYRLATGGMNSQQSVPLLVNYTQLPGRVFIRSYLLDNKLAYLMRPDGSYEHKEPAGGEQPLNVQNWFMHVRKRS